MKRTKFYSMAIFALALSVALCFTAALGALGRLRASASDYRPTSIFSAGTGGTVGVTEEGESDPRYLKFTLTSEGKVHYRRDLAFKWYEANGASTYKNEGAVRYFSMEFKFKELNFEEITLAFESAEENVSKDAKSTNTLHFYREEGKLLVALQTSFEQKEDWTPVEKKEIPYESSVALSLSEKLGDEPCEVGAYALYINRVAIGKLTNVGGNYLEYLSSASNTPRIPFTFTADKLAEDAESVSLFMMELNGQEFAINDAGRVDDNQPAALVIDEKIHAYTLGKRWNLTYKAIDVCDDSVTVSRKYAMLKTGEDGAFLEPSEEDYKELSSSTYFMPTGDDQSVDQLVSIYFVLDDGTYVENPGETQQQSPRTYLTWYAEEGAISHPGQGQDSCDFIKVNREQGGPAYVGLKAQNGENVKETDENGNAVLDELAESYQKAVEDASEGLSAGSGAYFYLPSLRGLIKSDYTDYRNLSFTIYYRKQGDDASASASATSTLKYNALRFEITAEGKYVFKVMASDGAGNAMKYFYEGKLQDVTSSNIWDIDEIPQFSFEAAYDGATIEKPKDPTSGYSGQSYTFTDFKVIALEGYEKKYTLYRLDQDEIPDNLVLPSQSSFMSNAEYYFEQFKPYLYEIKTYNDNVTESEEERWNNTDNDYHWDPDDALTFTPQEATYYILKLDVTESRRPGPGKTEYQVVDVRNKIDELPDVSDWLQNNLVAVILFSISAILMIILIIVLLTKPTEKTVEEIDLESLKGKKESGGTKTDNHKKE